MTDELLIASAALSDAATFKTASPTASDMGIGYLQTLQPGDACRFTDGADASLVVDMGSPVTINFVAALAVVGSGAADTMQLRGATSEANLTAAPGYNPGASAIWAKAGLTDWPFVHAVRYLDPAQTFQWWRFDWVFSGASLDVGRIMIDSAYVSPRAVDIGYRLNLVDTTITRTGQTGSTFVALPGAIRREPAFSFRALDEEDVYDAWQPLARKLGLAKDCFVWLAPGDLTRMQERAVHGLVTDREEVNAFLADFYQARIRFRELLPNSGINAI